MQTHSSLSSTSNQKINDNHNAHSSSYSFVTPLPIPTTIWPQLSQPNNGINHNQHLPNQIISKSNQNSQIWNKSQNAKEKIYKNCLPLIRAIVVLGEEPHHQDILVVLMGLSLVPTCSFRFKIWASFKL